MSKEFVLEKFEGPLELLLSLIGEAKLDITEISLGKVTEQFFSHLSTLGDDRTDVLADFLVVATKLVYLKSKELLPYLHPEENEGPSLADQLKLYARYAAASKTVAKLWERRLVGYTHTEPPPKIEGFYPPENATSDNVKKSFEQLLKRLKPVDPLPQVSIDRSISVKQQVQSLFDLVQKHRSVTFSQVLGSATSRTAVIINFLALLELVKQARISIQQLNSFEDLEINRV